MREDPQATWTYETVFPGADYNLSDLAVRPPRLVESVGTDGRFLGSVQSHPGFVNAHTYGLTYPQATTTVTSYTGTIVFAKYVSVYHGLSRDSWRGLAILTKDGSNRMRLYFAGTKALGSGGFSGTDVVLLEDMGAWLDITASDADDFDITSVDKYVYLSMVASVTGKYGASHYWPNKKPPYNRAYFQDFQINTWDFYQAGWQSRFAGILPDRVLGTAYNEDPSDSTRNSSSELSLSSDTNGTMTDPLPAGDHSFGVELVSRKHGLRSPLRVCKTSVETDGTTKTRLRLSLTSVGYAPKWPPETEMNYMGVLNLRTTGLKWTLSGNGVNEYYLTRTDGTNPWNPVTLPDQPNAKGVYENGSLLTEGTAGSLPVGGYDINDNDTLGFSTTYVRLSDETDPDSKPDGYIRQTSTEQGGGFPSWHNWLNTWGVPHADGLNVYKTVATTHSDDTGDYEPVNTLRQVQSYYEPAEYKDIVPEWSWDPAGEAWMSDSAVAQQEAYDPYIDEVGRMPRLRRVAAYEGLLVGVEDVEEPSDKGEGWETTDQRPEHLVWSSLTRDERENFPAANSFSYESSSERTLALEPGGDHLFAVTNQSVYVITRSGSKMAISRALHRLGGVSRYAQTGVGNSLFVVTRSGVKEVDGNTRQVRSLHQLDRIILDPSEWGSTLGNVQVEYDSVGGALIFLNTSKKECYVLWEATGAVTKLEDCPWDFVTSGVDGNGDDRAYFLMSSTGIIYSMAFSGATSTMHGAPAGETLNGTASGGSTTTIDIGSGTATSNLVGFEAYVRNPSTGVWEHQTIASVAGSVYTVDSPFSFEVDSSTRFSLAPIAGRVTLPHLQTPDDQGAFHRKVVHTMSASFASLGGDTSSSDVNAKVEMAVRVGSSVASRSEASLDTVPDQCIAYVNAGGSRVFPSLRWYGSNQIWELEAVQVQGHVSGSRRQTRRG